LFLWRNFFITKKEFAVFVAASTSCFPDLNLPEVLDRLADLEYSAAEIVVNETQGQLRPSELAEKFDSTIQICKSSRRITPVSFLYDVDPNAEKYFEHFTTLCQLAKALKIVSISVLPAKMGAFFNTEVERLQKLVHQGNRDGIHIGLMTLGDTLTDDPKTVGSFCTAVPGLTVTLDPTHYIYGCPKPKDYDAILDYVSHVRLRDSTKDNFQVQIGQGVIEYGRLVIQLGLSGYKRALCVDLGILPNIDPIPELRKMRLLLESLL